MSIADLIDPSRLAKGLWWEKTVTAVEGCSPASPACDHCWAEAGANMRQSNPSVAHRHAGLLTGGRYNGTIRLMHDDILKPLRWRKPAVITWWNDVFHEKVPFEFIDGIMSIIALTLRHVHIICTKRPQRASDYFQWDRSSSAPIPRPRSKTNISPNPGKDDPLPNLILMTTAEDQQRADERIPWLLKCPAACHSVAIEPMLDAVDLRPWLRPSWGELAPCACGGESRPLLPAIGHVILGGESGKGARPLLPTYVQRVRDHCAETGTPFLFKQWGEWVPEYVLEGETHQKGSQDRIGTNRTPDGRACYLVRVGKKAAGRLLDGRTHDGYPEVPHG